MNISVVILTKNEEKNILDCIESVRNVKEILIIDDFSTDRTLEVIERLNLKNIRVFRHRLDKNFSAQRNYGFSKATQNWVFFLDADERASEQLLSEIESIDDTKNNSYYIYRKDVLWGKQLEHGETGNIKLIRLVKKGAGKWSGKVHEVFEVNGGVGILKNKILHLPHQTIKEFIEEINFYTSLRAEELYRKNVKVTFIEIVLYPKAKFILNYFLKLGILDGLAGLNMALLMSLHSFLVRSKLWLLNNKNK